MAGWDELTEIWLRNKHESKPFQFCCKADPKRVKPQWADRFSPTGYSCVIDGERVFFFESERGRDAFCKTYRAEPCPLPKLLSESRTPSGVWHSSLV